MKQERLHLLDALRGLTLLSMIAYHGMFDLVMLYGVHASWYRGTPGYVWQQSICWTFILLSGYCWSLGSRPLKRGLLVFGGGLLVSLVTCLFLPSERVIFGILSFTGTAMLVMIPLRRLLARCTPLLGFLLSGGLFFLCRNLNEGCLGFEGLVFLRLPDVFYHGWFMTFLGFMEKDFFSGDYFSFFPWFFLYLCGYFLYRGTCEKEGLRRILQCHAAPLESLGRHSLTIYLLHQPLLMAACELLRFLGIL